MNRNDIEIMAPVGSFDSLMAAIQGGADSVYFGIEKMNMRSRSSANFTFDDLREIVRIAHAHNLKTYLTVNTVIYNDELPLMRQIIDAAKSSGVTAIIASDIAAIAYARQIGVEVHISTQCNVSNIEAVRFYSQWADVVVLARELNMQQVKQISQQIDSENIVGPAGQKIKIEMFAHGALCMAVSGKCYLSLDNMAASANRGACLQVCRRRYTVHDVESDIELEVDGKYIMSPRDLKTIRFLDKMIDAGVRVLKIEGRARSADYVRTVCQCYDEALRAIADGSFAHADKDAWDARLATVFNRGFWDGYYLGQWLGEWNDSSGSRATRRKTYVARVSNYFKKIGIAELIVEAGSFAVGDTLLFMGPKTGVVEVVVSEMRAGANEPVSSATKGCVVSLPVDGVRTGDKVYLWEEVGK